MPFAFLPLRRLAARLTAAALACVLLCSCGNESAETPLPDGLPVVAQEGVFCVPPAQAQALARRMRADQQGMRSFAELAFAVSQSLAYASTRPAERVAFVSPQLQVTFGQLAETLAHLQTLLPRLDAEPELRAEEFLWYRIGPDFGVTGYYEPTLRAARARSEAYPYPLYRLPPDLVKGVPYYTRQAIDREGALAGRGLELAWVSSETDAFFLHVQGSGRLLFEDGSASHVLYAGQNQRAYVSLGRTMRERGLLAPGDISMQSIRAYLAEHPGERAALFDANPSYVFFREAGRGPVGAMNKPLTPYVSLATDRSVLPHGSLVFAAATLPTGPEATARAFYALALPQDTGGAIKKNRIDLFCGAGDEAPHIAGRLNAKGAVHILLKRP